MTPEGGAIFIAVTSPQTRRKKIGWDGSRMDQIVTMFLISCRRLKCRKSALSWDQKLIHGSITLFRFVLLVGH